MTDKKETALTVVEKREIQKFMTAGEMEGQIRAYFEMQQVLDKALPDSIMEIQGRQFRKKSYWRAIAVAFGIELELVSEERFELPSQWGHKALYRAILPGGKSMVGDGICTSQEKRGASCTEHNVRSHAHTRAKNRAIADLVGFGEVSAEEVERDDIQTTQYVETKPTMTRDCLTYKQALSGAYKIAKAKGMSADLWKDMLKIMDIYPNDPADPIMVDKVGKEVDAFVAPDLPQLPAAPTMADCEILSQSRGIAPAQFAALVSKHSGSLISLWADLETCEVKE